jgi:hypothetical protein
MSNVVECLLSKAGYFRCGSEADARRQLFAIGQIRPVRQHLLASRETSGEPSFVRNADANREPPHYL